MKFITNTHDLEKYLEIKIRKYSSFKNISIDTRKIKKNSLFFAIKGDNFNGNDFAEDALKNGALIAFVDDKKFINNTNKRIIYVKDTIQTLRKICRNIIKDYDGKVIAITGSNGKTTTTNIIAKNSAPNNTKSPEAFTKLSIKNNTEWTGFFALITIKAERTATDENK